MREVIIVATEAKDDNQGKYTEAELRDRGVEKFRPERSPEWNLKAVMYSDEGVRQAFTKVKRSLILLCTDYKGHRYMEMAHRVAQIMIDKYLMQRCKGIEAVLPGPVISETSLKPMKAPTKAPTKGVLKATAVRADFKNWDGKIDTISDINWIYNNLMVLDVKAEDAPSPGAWAHLQYHWSNQAAMAEFFTKVYPRLIPAKSTVQKMQDKFHDDGRATFDLLDKLLEEDAAGEDEVPVLQVVLPERPRLQVEAGESPLPQADS